MSGRKKKGPAQTPRRKIEGWFPKLKTRKFAITSQPTHLYNCIAWAAGDDQNWWWPSDFGYWPPGVPRDDSLASFLEAFATLGFSPCDSSARDNAVEKIAIFGRRDRCSHAARQLDDGQWTSKLGAGWDISHSLNDLAGDDAQEYGVVLAVLGRKKSRASPSIPNAFS